MVGNILLVSLTPQQAVDDGNDLGAGDFIVGMESAVAVAYHPAIPGGVLNVTRSPMSGGHIPKAAVLLHDGGIAVAIGVKEPHRHGRELGAGDGLVPVEQSVDVAHSNAVAGQIGHIPGVPCVDGHIQESGFCGNGDALPIALSQQAGKDGGCLAPGHVPVRPKGAVGVAHHIGPVGFQLHHLGNRQLAVLVGFPGCLLAQIALDGDGQALLGLTLLVGDSDGDPVVLVHVGAVRQGDSDGAGFPNRYPGVRYGTLCLKVLHLDGQGPAVPIGVLPAHGALAVLIGGIRAAGDGELTGGVGLAAAEIVVAVRDGNAHARHGGLVLYKLDLDGGLVVIVQQAARGQPDGQGLVLMERDRGPGNGIFGVRVADRYQIAAHNGLALAVRGGLLVDFLDRLLLQLFTADLALFMAGTLAVRGGLLVNNPVAGLVSGGVGIVALVGVAAAGAGIGGVAHFRAGGSGHFLLVVVAQGIDNHRTALGTELGRGAGGRLAGYMTRCRVSLQAMIAAADAAILDQTFAGAGGASDFGALVPGMAQGVGVVCHKAGTAALADMDGLAAALAGGRGGFGNIVVGQGRRDVRDVALSADGALPQSVAGAGAGGRDGGNGELMLALGGGAFLDGAAPLTDFQHLAGSLAGGVPDNNTLERMAQGSLIVPLFDLAAIYAQIAVIAQGQAGGVHAVQQRPVVVLAAGAVTFCFLGAFVTQVDIGHAVLNHVGVLECIGDLIVHRIVSGLSIVGGAGQGAAVRRVAVVDGGGDTSLREIGHGDSVGLSIHHAEVVRNHGFCGGVGGFRIAAVGAGCHLYKAVVGQLRADAALHVVSLQGGRTFLVGAITESAVFAAGGGDTVILAVHLLNGFRIRQSLKEIVGAVIKPIHILQVTVIGLCHIGVNTTAGFTNSLGPMIAGIVGVLTGDTVQN
ncbi:Uncharacterised protein [Dorea longicatena]|uniref:Uncharacterized protein n=1 Tax=Dorea longicatena TaxID=88431 RepID=A0A564USP0_9FIRM|nr:Uncharacterised protein [Dorea longicatena]